MELVGAGGGWSLGESGVGTKVRLDLGLNSREEVLSLTDSKLLIRGMSHLIWTPPKLVPPGTNFSEIFGPTLKNLFHHGPAGP